MTKIIGTLVVLLCVCGAIEKAHAQLPDFVPLVKQNRAGVVNISTTRKPKISSKELELSRQFENTPYSELLKKFFDEQKKYYRYFEIHSLGSGTVVSEDGYIVTNFHVIRGADKIVVRLSDQRELPAKIIGTDSVTDIALLKIQAKNLSPVKLGDSKKIMVGEWVLAIGSPFGFEHSATAGIVSGIGRSIGSERYVPFIQTDVAINPGNSGGPLINMRGEVIGINAQILSQSGGGYLGLSFAIPINIVREVVEQLKDKGKVERGWLGIVFQPLTWELAKSFGLANLKGALVAAVLPNSPAEKAGIKGGDILISFNGEHIGDAGDLPPLVGELKPGTTIKAIILHDNKQSEVSITLGLLTEQKISEHLEENKELYRSRVIKNLLGMQVRDLTDSEKELIQKENNIAGGVQVVEVLPDSVAASAGLREGDVILTINRQAADSVKEFAKIVKGLPKDGYVPLLIVRDKGVQHYLALHLEK